MAKAKANKKSPSRKRYEEQHPTSSFRLDRETDRKLKEILKDTGRSCADFVKDAVEKERSMIAKRVEEPASSRQADRSFEERIRCLEDLVHQIFLASVDTKEYPPFCPRCDNQELCKCIGRETESALAHPWVFTWKCPKCGFFMNTSKRIDPKFIRWTDPDSLEVIDRPRTTRGQERKTSKQPSKRLTVRSENIS